MPSPEKLDTSFLGNVMGNVHIPKGGVIICMPFWLVSLFLPSECATSTKHGVPVKGRLEGGPRATTLLPWSTTTSARKEGPSKILQPQMLRGNRWTNNLRGNKALTARTPLAQGNGHPKYHNASKGFTHNPPTAQMVTDMSHGAALSFHTGVFTKWVSRNTMKHLPGLRWLWVQTLPLLEPSKWHCPKSKCSN